MFKRLSILAAAGAMTAACASDPGTAGGPSVSDGSGAVAIAPTTAAIANMATSTSWIAEERLLPQDPILALVSNGGSVESPAGLSVTCNPDNGKLTGRLGMQPAAKAGSSEAYRLRLGARADKIDGKFETNPQTNQTDFVFDMETAALRQMSVLESAAFVDAGGQVQWSFVKDPTAQVSARYIGSLSNMDIATQNFLMFCNPK